MNKALLCAALAGMITVSGAAQAADMAGKEKCFGIAKAGKNDCKSADGANSCAGQSTRNDDKNDWKFVEAGKCAEMGGKTMDAMEMKKM